MTGARCKGGPMLTDQQIETWIERATSLVCEGMDTPQADHNAAEALGIEPTHEALQELYEWEARCFGI